MPRNPLSFALLAAGCLAAAAAGGYYAVRQSRPAPAAPANEGAPSAQPVQEPARTPARPVEVERVRKAPVERTATAAPAPRRERAADPVRTAPRPAPAPAPSYGPIGGSPIAASEWPAIEQELTSHDPLPPPAATAPADAASQDADLKPIEQYVISADSVIGLVIDTPLSSETARVEDEVDAHVSRDVKVGDKVAIPAGTPVRGVVVEVDQGGKFHERARLGIAFDTIRMADGSVLPIHTDTIFRDGEAPGDAASRKIGASAVAGTILGAIFGGARGALIGGATGAAGGTALVEAGGHRPATFPAGATVTVRLRKAVTVTSEK
ncbi:MAG: hypothetical protein KGN76_11790 [Acidobacteriota bacterium]|nr:hypothetical protein [Acidobacteriota bacterium]